MAYPHREDQRAVSLPGAREPGRVQRRLGIAIERGWLVLHESGTFVKFAKRVRCLPNSGCGPVR